MLVEVRTVVVCGLGSSAVFFGATVAEGRVNALVEQLRRCASCPALAFEVLHEAIQSVGTCCAVGRNPR